MQKVWTFKATKMKKKFYKSKEETAYKSGGGGGRSNFRHSFQLPSN